MIEYGFSKKTGERFIFRRMEKKDLAEVNEIEQESFESPWPPEAIAFELEQNPFCSSFVIELNGSVGAYAFLWVIDKDSHLINIAVKGDARGRDIGGYFMKQLISFAKKKGAERMRLEVREKNAGAVNLYYKFDFEVIGSEKKYYSNGDDALIMLLVFGKNDCE